MLKINNAKAKIQGKTTVISAPLPPMGVGKYWYTSTSANDADKWETISSWYTDPNHRHLAADLPDSSTDVIILGSIRPYADIDLPGWVQPLSINSGSTGVEFYSNNFGNISCDIIGNSTFSGNATYNI